MSLLNKSAPDFTLPNEEGNEISLKDFKGKKILLVFYPGDNTSVCTKQLCSYSSGMEEFNQLGVNILGISMDSVESHLEFKKKFNLSFPLLSDVSGKIVEQYESKGFLGVQRNLFLIDENGKVIFQNESLPIFYKDTKDVLSELKKLF